MNIATLILNLDNTIRGKESYLLTLRENADYAIYPNNMVYKAMADMLELNIDELQRILDDALKIDSAEIG